MNEARRKLAEMIAATEYSKDTVEELLENLAPLK